MIDNYINYINAFKELDVEDKKEEIVNNFKELLDVLNKVNIKFNSNEVSLGVSETIDTEDNFLLTLFTYSVVLKEEYSKILNYIIKNGGVM